MKKFNEILKKFKNMYKKYSIFIIWKKFQMGKLFRIFSLSGIEKLSINKTIPQNRITIPHIMPKNHFFSRPIHGS